MPVRYTVFCCLLWVLWGHAEELQVNGGFERVVASKTGQVLPDGWLVNSGVSRDCTVLISKNPAEVRSGNFSLWLEGESSENRAYLMRYASRTAVKPGDVLRMSVWAQGKGEVSLGALATGTIPATGHSLGARTLAGKRVAVDSPENWQLCEFSLEVQPIRKNDLVFTDLSYVPIIYTFNMDVLLLDDCTFVLERAEEENSASKQEN
ncbi:MAG: hypothetical protein GX564_03730 [Oligosphaeraceae bacterium]|nr:hypothetical protein [Oligosphaeraceae bacterium]